MSVFVDKRYEELDWISQATEPVESPLNDLLGELPDEFLVSDTDTYLKIVGESWSMNFGKSRITNYLMNLIAHDKFKDLSWTERESIYGNFELDIVGEPILNFETNTIEGGEIRLLKTNFSIDQDKLKAIMGEKGLRMVRDVYVSNESLYLSRSNEVLQLIGTKDALGGLKTRSRKSKRIALYRSLELLLKSNEWNIKSADLANKIGSWIADYIAYGNLASMSNLCRLKVMTHRGLPIYSIEEVQ